MEYHFTVPGILPGLNDYLKAERKFTRRGGTAHSVGNDMKQENQMLICNAIRLKGEGSYVQTALNGEYTLLTGYVAPSSQFSSSLMAKIIVYGDNDQVLYTSKDIHYNEKAFYFGADVTGQNQIRVEVSLTVDNDWDEPVILMDGLSLYK